MIIFLFQLRMVIVSSSNIATGVGFTYYLSIDIASSDTSSSHAQIVSSHICRWFYHRHHHSLIANMTWLNRWIRCLQRTLKIPFVILLLTAEWIERLVYNIIARRI